MKRQKFLKNSIMGLGSMFTIPALVSNCKKEDELLINEADCVISPYETPGPYPNKTPAELVRENIVGNRTGVPLLIQIKVENTLNNCEPLADVLVDIWHCDAKGNYSEYSGQLNGNFTNEHFLRGRQTTDTNGMVSFISIYPGWYSGRAPHIHFEIKQLDGESLLITQTAFPDEISKVVYTTDGYVPNYDTSNAADSEFGISLNRNLATSVIGNSTDGYTLTETIKVAL